jgi:hypothetical protein
MKKILYYFILFYSISIVFTACKKADNVNEPTQTPAAKKTRALASNPFAIANVQSLLSKYAPIITEASTYSLQNSQRVLYVRTNPSALSTEQFEKYQSDASIKWLSYPIYKVLMEGIDITEENADEYADGYVYAFVTKGASIVTDLNCEVLDELYAPTENEVWLHSLILYEAKMLEDADLTMLTKEIQTAQLGGTAVSYKAFKWWPSPKQPDGDIRYWDTKIAANTPVVNVEVVAIYWFSTPSAFTNTAGHFHISSGFLFGTDIYVNFGNSNGKIYPFKWIGILNKISSIMFAIISNTASSGNYWHKASDLPNIHIVFGAVGVQSNFYSLIMNGLYYHMDYNTSNGIAQPFSNLSIWAFWDNKDESTANTYMLKDISKGCTGLTSTIVTTYLQDKLGECLTPSVVTNTASSIVTKLLGMLPDVKLSNGKNYYNVQFNSLGKDAEYSSDIMKTILHEFSHVGMYYKVGCQYWYNVGLQEKSTEGGGNYGFGNIYQTIPVTSANWFGPIPSSITIDKLDNYIELTEAWAEFLGERYTLQYYSGNTPVARMHSPVGGGALGASNTYGGVAGATPYAFFTINNIQENGKSWADRYITKGMFYDLMDNKNKNPDENVWDNIGSYTIAEMYNTFDNTRPAHVEYLTALGLLHGHTYTQLEPLWVNNQD